MNIKESDTFCFSIISVWFWVTTVTGLFPGSFSKQTKSYTKTVQSVFDSKLAPVCVTGRANWPNVSRRNCSRRSSSIGHVFCSVRKLMNWKLSFFHAGPPKTTFSLWAKLTMLMSRFMSPCVSDNFRNKHKSFKHFLIATEITQLEESIFVNVCMFAEWRGPSFFIHTWNNRTGIGPRTEIYLLGAHFPPKPTLYEKWEKPISTISIEGEVVQRPAVTVKHSTTYLLCKKFLPPHSCSHQLSPLLHRQLMAMAGVDILQEVQNRKDSNWLESTSINTKVLPNQHLISTIQNVSQQAKIVPHSRSKFRVSVGLCLLWLGPCIRVC